MADIQPRHYSGCEILNQDFLALEFNLYSTRPTWLRFFGVACISGTIFWASNGQADIFPSRRTAGSPSMAWTHTATWRGDQWQAARSS